MCQLFKCLVLLNWQVEVLFPLGTLAHLWPSAPPEEPHPNYQTLKS